VLDWSELAYLLVRNGVVGSATVALIVQTGQGIRERWRGRDEVTRIKVASECKVAEIKAALDVDMAKIQATTQAKIAEMSAAHELQLARERDRANRRPRRQPHPTRSSRRPTD
jgi:hypothetical protein